jgi:hypothetical protein
VFAKPISNLSSLPKKKSAATKGLAADLKYCYGACVKRNRHKTAEELSKEVNNILDHICGEHGNCDIAWCYDKKAMEQNLLFNPPSDHHFDRLAHPETYKQTPRSFQVLCIC